MSDQPALFDNEDQAAGYQRPAHINPAKCGTLTNYRYGCRCPACRQAKKNHNAGDRRCKHCGKHFHLSDEGAGTKYCSDRCKAFGYKPLAAHPQPQTCATCGTDYTAKRQTRAYRWQLCPDCLDTIEANQSAIANHKVPPHLIHSFVKNPTCHICGTNIAGRKRNQHGQIRPAAVIDHDHECCDKEQSCGDCVRGFICDPCNRLMPHRPGLTKLLEAAVAYLHNYERRTP